MTASERYAALIALGREALPEAIAEIEGLERDYIELRYTYDHKVAEHARIVDALKARAEQSEARERKALASAQALADAAGPFAAACLEMPSDLAPDKIVAHVPAGPRAEAFKRLGAYLTAGNFRDLSSAMVAFQKAGQP